jgi:hypothetical protein
MYEDGGGVGEAMGTYITVAKALTATTTNNIIASHSDLTQVIVSLIALFYYLKVNY